MFYVISEYFAAWPDPVNTLGYEALNSLPPSMELKSQLNGRETEEVSYHDSQNAP